MTPVSCGGWRFVYVRASEWIECLCKTIVRGSEALVARNGSGDLSSTCLGSFGVRRFGIVWVWVGISKSGDKRHGAVKHAAITFKITSSRRRKCLILWIYELVRNCFVDDMKSVALQWRIAE